MKWFLFIAFLLGSFHVNEAGITVAANSFTLTAPATYTISTTTAVDFTYSIGLGNDGGSDKDVASVDLYLSDDELLTNPSAPFTGTASPAFPITVTAGADGSTLTTGITASVIADETKCSSYTKICVKVMPGDVIACVDIPSDSKDCPNCPVFVAPENGVIMPEDATLGSVLISCNEGYVISSSNMVTCTDKEWTSIPTCDECSSSGVVPALSTFTIINVIVAILMLINV
ncbi:uncharacterized protein LOC144434590 [Glandiceps talaboti]